MGMLRKLVVHMKYQFPKIISSRWNIHVYNTHESIPDAFQQYMYIASTPELFNGYLLHFIVISFIARMLYYTYNIAYVCMHMTGAITCDRPYMYQQSLLLWVGHAEQWGRGPKPLQCFCIESLLIFNISIHMQIEDLLPLGWKVIICMYMYIVPYAAKNFRWTKTSPNREIVFTHVVKNHHRLS